jgi:UDP-glucose 4-epimerase
VKVLLTGGAGFIGSHVADHLLARGEEVTILDNLSTGRRENLPPGAEFVEMDVRDGAVRDLWEERRFEVLLHFAAQMSVLVSVRDPLYDVDVNVRGLLNLMEAGRGRGLRRTLFASTGGAAYDDEVPFPTPETAPARPLAPYGIAKVASELYLRYYSRSHNIPYTALRFGNVYGPRQDPGGEAGVIAIFASKLLDGEAPVINGDGEQTRDYIFVGDVARAFLAALDKGVEGVFNIGNEREVSVNEICARLKEVVGTELEPIYGPAKAGEVRRSMLAIGKAQAGLGWEPEVDLKQGVAEVVDFIRRRRENPEAR